jgi:hypothetical protein
VICQLSLTIPTLKPLTFKLNMAGMFIFKAMQLLLFTAKSLGGKLI